jgi:flavin reductase (DIM6/NTAB) family NADH-FMN oxidoreductase RutF
MHELPYGLYIIGSKEAEGDKVNGMMADWVMQVSFNPRLVAVAFERDAHTLGNVR